MGYDNQHRGYRLFSLSHRAVFISRDVKFNELPTKFAFNEDVDDLDDSSIASNWLDINLDKSPQE